MGAKTGSGRKVFLTLAFLVLSAGQLAAQPIVSDFSTDDDGWTVSDNPTTPPPGPSTVPTYNPTGGSTGGGAPNPGGWISDTDLGPGRMGLEAPAKFLGDLSGYYGKTLSWHRWSDTTGSPIDTTSEDVIMESGNVAFDLWFTGLSTIFMANMWDTTPSTTLSEVGWVRSTDMMQPTMAQFQSALGDVTRLSIRIDNDGGFETAGIDNVTITPVELQSFAIE